MVVRWVPELMRGVALRRQIGVGDAQQGAAQAIAQRVDFGFAGGLLDGIQRRQRAVLQIVVERLFGHLLVGLIQDIRNTVKP
jgi:hypothetical protein